MRFPLVFISCAERSGTDGPCDGGVDFEDRVLLDWMGEGEGVGVMCCVVLCCFVVMDTRCLSCLLFISSSLLDTWSRFFFHYVRERAQAEDRTRVLGYKEGEGIRMSSKARRMFWREGFGTKKKSKMVRSR